jgi:Ca2+-binding RTX toxin-like protein
MQRNPNLEPLESRGYLAVVASFSNGTLSVFGDNLDNSITISRNTAGTLLVNGGAVNVIGGTATVANTSLIQVFGQAGNDTITLNEANGPLPAANLFGGAGNDNLTGGAGNDFLFGQAGNDVLLGKGGNDLLFGGADNDVLTGGTGDDQSFGEAGDDRMVWNPGDGTDLNEGGDGIDITEVNGGNGAETFAVTANGTRVRFDRGSPAPFSIDIGTTENLVLNANGGDDSFSATGNLAPLITITVDGGAGNDSLNGGNGADILRGGVGDDFIDGNQGNDVVFLGAGNDVFQWDPGDGSDIVEGQAGVDRMVFNGANIAENIDISANGGRVRFTRNIGSIVMDLNDVEVVDFNALGGADAVTVNNLADTDTRLVNVNLAAAGGGGDGAADSVIVNGTAGDDILIASGNASTLNVAGAGAVVSVTTLEPATDQVVLNGLGGDDVILAGGVSGIGTFQNGGTGNDVLIGGSGSDVLFGSDGDDVLIGGPALDVLDGGTGSNILIQD